MSGAIKHFIGPLSAAFGEPSLGAPFIARLEKELAEFENDELNAGADALIRGYKKRGFPTIAECLEALADPDSYAPQKVRIGKRPFNAQRARRMLCCDLGRVAAAEGWASLLYVHFGLWPRMPSQNEQLEMRAKAEKRKGSTWYASSHAAELETQMAEVARGTVAA